MADLVLKNNDLSVYLSIDLSIYYRVARILILTSINTIIMCDMLTFHAGIMTVETAEITEINGSGLLSINAGDATCPVISDDLP